jgi:hypothetical protein
MIAMYGPDVMCEVEADEIFARFVRMHGRIERWVNKLDPDVRLLVKAKLRQRWPELPGNSLFNQMALQQQQQANPLQQHSRGAGGLFGSIFS